MATPPFRILDVVGTLDPAYGGPVSVLSALTRGLSAAGADVTLCTLSSASAEWKARFLCKVIDLGPARLRMGSMPYQYSERFVPWLKQNRAQFDAVLVHGLWQYQSLGTRRALRGSGVPYFVFPHGSLDPWFKRAYPLKHLKKWLYWPWAEYRVLRDARAVLFTSQDEMVLARQSFWLYRANEIVINYGTEAPPDRVHDRADAFLRRHEETRGKRIILFLGRLHEKKGCDLLVKAFAAVATTHPEVHLVIAGPDQRGLRPALERLAASAGVDHRITWTGMLTGDMKWGAMAAADAFVLPSHSENFGIAVAEALGCGVPVLVSDKVNIWREIVSEGAGFVDSDDEEGTKRLLSRWLRVTPEQRREMSANAMRCFNERYELTSSCRRLLELMRAGSLGDER